ncbi:exosortase [Hydrocarboniclastica marina]|uniref:Exosortase n=1 Tax=Hydrocarboniclastica marina TaxID=2259620 RepID=A0A4P7XHN0_9ALTE|nr:exosortase [Hydrocarboniclastica marina]
MEGLRVVRSTAVFAVLLAAFVAGTYPVLEKIGLRWMKFDEAYSHGWMIFGVSLYLIVRAWRAHPPRVGFHPLWLVVLGVLVAVYTAAGLLYVEAVQQFLLVPMLLVIIATVAGWATMWRFLLPVGVLVFAIPFWDYAAWPLQLITVEINKVLLSLWGIEFEVEGVLVFLIGVGAFEIAHGCSGLRYLIVAMALATVYSELNYRLWRNRILLFTFAVFLALLTNWIRVFVIIYQGYVTDMTSSLINEHDFFGWALFAGTLVPLFILAGRLERTPVQSQPSASTADSPRRPASPAKAGLVTLVATAILLAPLSVLGGRDARLVQEKFSISLDAPENWSPLFQRQGRVWEPKFSGEDHMNRFAWFRAEPGQGASMPDFYAASYILTYESQGPGKELIHDSNRMVDTRRWQPDGNFDLTVNGEPVSGMVLKDRATGDKAVVIYGFYVSGAWSSDPVGAKLLQLYSAINGRPDASLVAAAVHCGECDAREAAEDWVGELMAQAESAIDARFAKPD